MLKLLFAPALVFLVASAAKAENEFAITAEGGVSRYNQTLSGSNLGAAYGARLSITPITFLGVELGYLGTRNDVNGNTTSGLDPATLSTNEGYADLRINVIPGPITPYVFGGYGLTWLSGAAVSGIPNDHVNTLPFGAGLDFNIGMFKIGGRFQYNYLFNSIFAGTNGNGSPTTAGVDKGGHSDFWTATLALGVSFH